jgi:prophage antirepressor-like protein
MSKHIHQTHLPEIGTVTNFINAKGEFAFLAKEICKILELKNISQSIINAELVEGKDYKVIKKKDYRDFFETLYHLKVVTPNTPSAVLIFESGLWLLCQNSRKVIGQKLRRWLADEVLPSIRKNGKYEAKRNPFISPKEAIRLKDEVEQKTETKLVHKVIWDKEKKFQDIINYELKNHLMVHGRTPKQLKEQYNEEPKSKSGKEILRKYEPYKAVGMAYNDFLVEHCGYTLDELNGVSEVIENVAKQCFEKGFELRIGDQSF